MFLEEIKPVEIIVDRIENDNLVLEINKNTIVTFNIKNSSKIKEGDVLEIDIKSKKISVNKKKTKKRKQKIRKLMNEVFE